MRSALKSQQSLLYEKKEKACDKVFREWAGGEFGV